MSEAIFPTTWGIFGQGILGVKEDFQGVPWGHWVGLMGFLLIHKAYVPWSRFLARDGRVDGSTKDSIRGPRGPEKLGRWYLVFWKCISNESLNCKYISLHNVSGQAWKWQRMVLDKSSGKKQNTNRWKGNYCSESFQKHSAMFNCLGKQIKYPYQ